ncbi:MAG TPA: HD domain-containing protein [Patescibacteria group bacterium]
MINYFSIIQKYVPLESDFYRIYVIHVTLVTNKALSIARRLNLSAESLQFIEEAGMLHDIGIVKVKSEKFKAHNGSELPYIAHGTQGAEILRAEGLPQHARVAERHTGVGITQKEIEERNLPLPHQDFVPETIEEEIISYADLFFSKRESILWQEETPEQIRAELAQYGEEQVTKFDEWQQRFGG